MMLQICIEIPQKQHQHLTRSIYPSKKMSRFCARLTMRWSHSRGLAVLFLSVNRFTSPSLEPIGYCFLFSVEKTKEKKETNPFPSRSVCGSDRTRWALTFSSLAHLSCWLFSLETPQREVILSTTCYMKKRSDCRIKFPLQYSLLYWAQLLR